MPRKWAINVWWYEGTSTEGGEQRMGLSVCDDVQEEGKLKKDGVLESAVADERVC